MTLLEFVQKINLIKEKSALKEAIVSFVNTPPGTGHPDEEYKIEQFLETITKDAFGSFGQNLGFCKGYCLEELKKEGSTGDRSYIQKLTDVKNALDDLSRIYQGIIDKKEAEKDPTDDPYTLEQQRGVLRELVDETKQLKNDIDKANNDIVEANKSLDSKIFSLLTNTVAILGIFVAIAFTGFGTMSILSNIDLPTAITSTEAFVKNVFFILLVSALIYNLLLLLVYFIYKLSRPVIHLSSREDRFSKIKGISTFSQVVNLKPFLWVDGALALLTIAAFVASLLI